MQANKSIGELLKELGYITQEQINIALSVQKSNPKYFGEILQELDFITSIEVAEAVAKQNGLDYIHLDQVFPSLDALRLIPQDVARARNILPISINEETLIVATDDVNDLVTLDYLRKLSKKHIKFVVGDRASIARYAEIFYYQLDNPIEAEIQEAVSRLRDNLDIDIPKLVELLLNSAIKDHATDIHITPETLATHIFYRIDGVLQHYYSLPLKIHTQIVARIKILSNLDISEQRKPQDGSFGYEFLNESSDLRVSTLPTSNGENIVMRLLSKNGSLFSLTHLGLSEKNSAKIERYFSKSYGIILVVGPTGSGKTTTLYSALRKVNSLKKNVLTIEDPVEYKFSFIKQTQLNEKAGYTFDAAIRAFMRQDPDIILVGEIRDTQTAELAIRASITGHLVLSTLHTNDAVGTIARLSDLKIPPYLISSGLLVVVAQRLIRKLCNYCKRPINLTSEELLEQGVPKFLVDNYTNHQLYEAVGCEHCRQSGYIGREVIVEILEIDKEIESMITQEADSQEILRVAQEKGMHLMKEDGYIKAFEGKTTIDEIHRIVN
ncbi:MAG: Flp pilus assembly complex ATPase component TadA [Epsilonproteobacteria bacterium]|nr:Flp pilus assembly complex ATPase component TadA [Campylobacterota bacterium]